MKVALVEERKFPLNAVLTFESQKDIDDLHRILEGNCGARELYEFVAKRRCL